MVIILFFKESGSLFIAEVGEITRLSFPFVWLEADKEYLKMMALPIPPSLLRFPDQLESRQKKFGRQSPSHTVTLATVLGSDIPVSGLVA